MRDIIILAALLFTLPACVLISRIVRYKFIKLAVTVISTVISLVSVCLLLVGERKHARGLMEISKPLIDINWLFTCFILVILAYLVYASIRSSNVLGMVLSALQLFGYAAFRVLNPQTPGTLAFRIDYLSLIPAVAGAVIIVYALIKRQFGNIPLITGLIWSLYIISVADSLLWIYFSLVLASSCIYQVYINGKDKIQTKSVNIQLLLDIIIAVSIYISHYMFSISSFIDIEKKSLLMFFIARFLVLLPVFYRTHAMVGVIGRTGQKSV